MSATLTLSVWWGAKMKRFGPRIQIIVTSLLALGVALYLITANFAVKAGLAASLWDTGFPMACICFVGGTFIGAYFNRLLSWMALVFAIGLFFASKDPKTILMNVNF